MDREDLLQAIRSGQIIIRMNDGREYAVDGVETAMVTMAGVFPVEA